jgi:hypothetical protein
MRAALAVIALAALAAAGSGVHPSRAAFTAQGKNPANTFTTASDWIPPAVTLTAPTDGSYTDDTTPTFSGAAGTVAGDATTVTLHVYSGPAATGTPLQTLSATRSGATWSATATALPAGATYTARATQTDSGGNTGTSLTTTFTVDTTPPVPAMISAANASGGTAGRLGAGDSITYQFSEPIVPTSVLSTFTGGTTTASVSVRFTNAGSADTLRILDSASVANVNLDISVATNANLVTGTVTWPATMSQSSDGTSFTIVLGTAPTSGVATTVNTAKNMVWTARAGPTDRAGNALSILGTILETDSDVDF